jgi:hypothetical protein
MPVSVDFGDDYATGYTGRGQVGYATSLAEVHFQAGYTWFRVEDVINDKNDLGFFHAGAGVRIGFGVFLCLYARSTELEMSAVLTRRREIGRVLGVRVGLLMFRNVLSRPGTGPRGGARAQRDRTGSFDRGRR